MWSCDNRAMCFADRCRSGRTSAIPIVFCSFGCIGGFLPSFRHLLKSYQRCYNEVRTHLSLGKDAPASRAVQAVGQIFAQPHLGELHHQYVRIITVVWPVNAKNGASRRRRTSIRAPIRTVATAAKFTIAAGHPAMEGTTQCPRFQTLFVAACVHEVDPSSGCDPKNQKFQGLRQ